MTSVDKTVAILSTIHGFVPDDAQCEALRERLRVVCTVRDVAFTMHEVALRATASGTSGGNAVDKDVRIRTITEDAQLCVLRMTSNIRIPSEVETREVYDAQISHNAEMWLIQIGFNYSFEYFREGFRYAVILDPTRESTRSLYIHIFVYKLKKLVEKGNFSNMVDMSPGYVVEMQCEEDPQNSKDYGKRLLNFAKSFSSFVVLPEHQTR